MKQAPVILVAAHRPDYFKQVVDSLIPQSQNRDIFISLDLVPGAENLQQDQADYVRRYIPHASVIHHARHLGCGQHMIFARHFMFDEEKYERAFILEDDLILSKHHLQLCENLMDWCDQHYDNVGVVQAWNEHPMPHEEKMQLRNSIENTEVHWWAYLMKKQCWDAIKPMLFEFSDKFLAHLTHYGRRNHRKINWWRSNKVQQLQDNITPCHRPFPINESERRRILSSLVSSQDGITATALYLAGMCKVATYVNRGRYIGEWGVHKNPDLYRALGLDRIHMFECDEDAELREFDVH